MLVAGCWHGKVTLTRFRWQEFAHRLSIFEDNLKYIQEYNAKSTGATVRRGHQCFVAKPCQEIWKRLRSRLSARPFAQLGLTAFADMSHDEFKTTRLGALSLS